MSRLVAEISSKNLRDNIIEIKKIIGPNTKLMVMVKANAYGHGIVEVSKIIESQVDYFGVANIGEAITLRKSGINSPILVTGYSPFEDFKVAIENNITLTLIDNQSIKKLNALTRKKVPIHLKFNTGMNRFGANPEALPKLIRVIKDCPNVFLEGIFSHFASNNEIDNQLRKFKRIVTKTNTPLVHIANSNALKRKDTHFNMVRAGIAAYGFSNHLKVKPALKLKTFICQTIKINKGESVGYEGKFVAKKKSTIGSIPIGFADGLRRSPYPWKNAQVKGKVIPIIGFISMDQATVDLTATPSVKPGDEVTLIGGKIKITDIAHDLQTSIYEVLSTLGPRIERKVI